MLLTTALTWECRLARSPPQGALGVKFICPGKHHSPDFSDGEEHMTQKATHVSHFNEPNPSVQSLLLGQGVRNAQLTCLQSPPLEACRVEEARQLGHQSGPQDEETPVPRPRFLERRLPAARRLPPY